MGQWYRPKGEEEKEGRGSRAERETPLETKGMQPI